MLRVSHPRLNWHLGNTILGAGHLCTVGCSALASPLLSCVLLNREKHTVPKQCCIAPKGMLPEGMLPACMETIALKVRPVRL